MSEQNRYTEWFFSLPEPYQNDLELNKVLSAWTVRAFYAGVSIATAEANKRIAELESEVAELKAELDKFGVKKQLYKDKWVVYKPEDAPYAGIRTEDGVTIAGTSSGLSEQDAHEICANRVDADSLFAMVGMLANERTKITELQADNNRLREALEIARDYQFDAVNQFHADFAGYKEDKHKQYDADLANTEQALSATPAESLQAHDGEVSQCKIDAERYQFVRKLNPREFAEIYDINIKTGVHFDHLISQALKEVK